jgi:hypothetical protein
VGRLELASGNSTAGTPVSFYFTNQGTDSVTLRSTAPWLVRKTSSDGPVIYVAVGAGVIQEVTPGNRYPVSGAWAWTPDLDGDYYIELNYECAGVYPLLTHLHLNVSAAGIPEFPSSWMLVATVTVALGVALSLAQKRQRHQSVDPSSAALTAVSLVVTFIVPHHKLPRAHVGLGPFRERDSGFSRLTGKHGRKPSVSLPAKLQKPFEL